MKKLAFMFLKPFFSGSVLQIMKERRKTKRMSTLNFIMHLSSLLIATERGT